ncbi:hypothetical protein JT359_02145 [Candidatus Poribacteria bacterium]|nr:hypothetical protein [Candidatus Poribacteria bacterium]
MASILRILKQTYEVLSRDYMYYINNQNPITLSKVLQTILLLCLGLFFTGCATLFQEQEYVLIDRPVDKDYTYYYDVFTLPEIAKIRKIRLIGEGKLRNIEIHVRDAKHRWKLKKKIHRINQLPLDIPLTVDTDAIKVKKAYTTVFGEIKTIQFFTVVDKGENKH